MTKNNSSEKTQEYKPSIKARLKRISLAFLIVTVFSILIVGYFFLNIKDKKQSIIIEPKPLELIKKFVEKPKKEILTTIEDKDFTQNIRIEELEEKYKKIDLRLNNINISNELSKIIITFSELRSAIELEENFEVKLEELSLLSIKDSFLSNKIEELRNLLREKSYKIEDITLEFKEASDKIIVSKHQNLNENISIIDKFKNILAQLVIIRRIDGKIKKESDNIDLAITKLEKLLTTKSYNKALLQIKSLEKSHQNNLKNITKMIHIQAELNKISKEIFLYLKKIANNA